MSVSIADSFGDRAWVFTVAYVTMQLGRTAYIVFATWRHDRVVARDFVCVLAWTAVGSALWIAGGLLPLSVQLGLWALALGVVLLGTLLGFRVPGSGTRTSGPGAVGPVSGAYRGTLRVVRAHRDR